MGWGGAGFCLRWEKGLLVRASSRISPRGRERPAPPVPRGRGRSSHRRAGLQPEELGGCEGAWRGPPAGGTWGRGRCAGGQCRQVGIPPPSSRGLVKPPPPAHPSRLVSPAAPGELPQADRVGGEQSTIATFAAELGGDPGESHTGAESCPSAWEGPMEAEPRLLRMTSPGVTSGHPERSRQQGQDTHTSRRAEDLVGPSQQTAACSRIRSFEVRGRRAHCP